MLRGSAKGGRWPNILVSFPVRRGPKKHHVTISDSTQTRFGGSLTCMIGDTEHSNRRFTLTSDAHQHLPEAISPHYRIALHYALGHTRVPHDPATSDPESSLWDIQCCRLQRTSEKISNDSKRNASISVHYDLDESETLHLDTNIYNYL